MDIHEDEVEDGEERRKEEGGKGDEREKRKKKQVCLCVCVISKQKIILTDGECLNEGGSVNDQKEIP